MFILILFHILCDPKIGSRILVSLNSDTGAKKDLGSLLTNSGKELLCFLRRDLFYLAASKLFLKYTFKTSVIFGFEDKIFKILVTRVDFCDVRLVILGGFFFLEKIDLLLAFSVFSRSELAVNFVSRWKK